MYSDYQGTLMQNQLPLVQIFQSFKAHVDLFSLPFNVGCPLCEAPRAPLFLDFHYMNLLHTTIFTIINFSDIAEEVR